MSLLRLILPEWMFDKYVWKVLIIDAILFGGIAWVAMVVLNEITK
jgi:hypothetical protein